MTGIVDYKLHLPTEAALRNEYPMWDGLMAYFPAALAEMARLSKIGNDQHNPGEHMHWAREKSRDHKNKILKHMLDTGPVDAPVYDTDNVLHSIKMAWRACAFAQEQLEALGRPHGENAAPAENVKNDAAPELVASQFKTDTTLCPAANYSACMRGCVVGAFCDRVRRGSIKEKP